MQGHYADTGHCTINVRATESAGIVLKGRSPTVGTQWNLTKVLLPLLLMREKVCTPLPFMWR